MFVFIAVTSIGTGGSPPPVIASIILPIPRYNVIAATPSVAFNATHLPPLLQDHVLQIYQHQ